MLIENKGVKTDTFYIPPFNLNAGEILVLYLFNGQHFYDTEMFLKDIFCGVSKDENVVVHKTLTFVEHFTEPRFRRFFQPMTVEDYLKKNANLDSPYATKIYEIKWINKKTKLNAISSSKRQLLSLYATLSKTNNIVFDLVGQDVKTAEKSYEVIKEAVRKGGSAILLDWVEDLRNDCTEYIELQWTKGI